MKLFCSLTDSKFLFPRCGQLDSALTEATSRVRTLEKKNNLLEIEVVRAHLRAGSSARCLNVWIIAASVLLAGCVTSSADAGVFVCFILFFF